MDANVFGEGPSHMNNEETNTHAENIDELYDESREEGELDPLADFDFPSLEDTHMEDPPIQNQKQ